MKRIFFSVFSVLLGLTLFSSCQSKTSLPTIVQTQNGEVEGILDTTMSVVAFKGIPFAAPPVGNLRWKAPQPVQNWEGVRECKEFSASAMQPTPAPFLMWTSEFIAPAKPLSEDCLYLNVWTANPASVDKRPVIVFIHGGGFTSGSGSVPIYDGEEIAKAGVVFVTINYRVGIFGFFAHPELTAESLHHASGNYGLLDQIAALKWVQKNIAAFGGDPTRVTIAGQSAGAFSVNFLVASPLAKGLFQRAIAESGGAVLPTSRFAQSNTLEQAEGAGEEVAAKLNASSIADLRKIPAEELLKVRTMSSPIIDGYALPTDLYTIFSKGEQNDVPVLTGWNAQEGNFSGPLVDAATFKKRIEEKYGAKAEKFLKLFPASNDSEAQKSQLELSGLQTFGVQAFKWMQFQNQTGHSKVFMYHFTRALPYGEGQKPYGAFHTGEVPYAYKNLHMSKVRPWEDVDYHLSDIMSSYWINFAKNGDPNGPGLLEWKPCAPDDYETMYLGKTCALKTIPHLKALELLENHFESIN